MESDILGAALQNSGVENSAGERYRRDARATAESDIGGAQGTAGVGGLAGERSGARAAGRAAVESDIADALQDGGGERYWGVQGDGRVKGSSGE